MNARVRVHAYYKAFFLVLRYGWYRGPHAKGRIRTIDLQHLEENPRLTAMYGGVTIPITKK